MSSLHERVRDHAYDDSCFGCRAARVQFNVSGEWNDIESRERTLSRDLAAYESLVKQGYQPTSPIGAAAVAENATHRLHIEDPNNPVLTGMTDRQLDEFQTASSTIAAEADKEVAAQ